MNSQQKGGDEPCPPNSTTESGCNAAPTSDPEGAATEPAAICVNCGFDWNLHKAFGENCPLSATEGAPWRESRYMEGAATLNTKDDPRLDIMPAVREALGFHEPSQNETATPLPSVTETAKEILEGITPITSDEAMIHEIESILSRFLGAREHELRELRAELETRIRHSDGLFASLESSQAECQRIVEALNSAGIVREKLRAECERLRMAFEELRDVTQELVTLAEVWTPEFTRTIHNARCVLIDAAMKPSEPKGKP